MQTKLQLELASLREGLARQNRQLEEAKELLAGQDSRVLVPFASDVFAELDRACDVVLRPAETVHVDIQTGAIRA